VKRVADYYSERTGTKITINDVFCSCISDAIVKLLRYHRAVHPNLGGQKLALPYMNLVIPVHMQGGILLPGQSMGNKIGAMVSRIPGEEGFGGAPHRRRVDDGGANNFPSNITEAEDRLVEVHRILQERKQTPAAVLSYLVANIVGSLGSSEGSYAPWLFEMAHANASVVVTNVRGPEQTVHLAGRQVEAFLGFLPLPPGIPIGMVVGSYNGQLTLTVTAEPWAVPDADRFLSWVAEAYETLSDQAQMQGKKDR
jgi:diacylglycerol O-acyltransferase / wax synthase